MLAIARITLAATLLGATVANAQTITGTVTGIVKDASGAVLPGATINMKHLQTDRQETAVSDAQGRFTSAPLPLGNYRIEASLSGFKSVDRKSVV